MKILFMGSPDFAVYSLTELISKKYKIVGVITSPDNRSGRGMKIKKSPVKLLAEKKGLTILQPTNLKDKDFLIKVRKLNPDIGIVVAFRMLPKNLWEIPKLGTFNLHASLLPDFRGAAPINWSIINQEKTTGVTTFFIDENIDTGNILLQKKISIQDDETSGSLHDKLALLGNELIIETIASIKSGVQPKKQITNGDEKKAPKLTKENTRIDWSKDIRQIESLIKGLNPYPGAWTYFYDSEETIILKIFKVSIKNNKKYNSKLKIEIEDKNIFIEHPQGLLQLEFVQLPNKKRMDSISLLNGFNFKSGSKVI